MKITIDPGHGGHNSGAVGAGGMRESDTVLGIAQQLLAMLTYAGHEVQLTRWDDTFRELQQRCDAAKSFNAGAFISIHCNAVDNSQANGFEVWTDPDPDEADELAGRIWYSLRSTFPDMKGRADFSDGDPDKESKFWVLVHTHCPAVLIELAFISNPEDINRLRSPQWRNKAVAAIAKAVEEWF
jgi:N-acetylmuramoyl-L-alanine amidase